MVLNGPEKLPASLRLQLEMLYQAVERKQVHAENRQGVTYCKEIVDLNNVETTKTLMIIIFLSFSL